MIWKVAKAKQHLSELIRAASTEPQRIFNRDHLVAAVVNGATFEEFEAWREAKEQGSIGRSFAELRRLCRDEDYELAAVARQDRANPWAQALEDLDDDAEAL